MLEKLKNMNKDNKNTELDNTDKKLHISDVIKSLPTEQDCIITGHERKSKLPIEYDKNSYELGFHQAYNWMLSQIYKGFS